MTPKEISPVKVAHWCVHRRRMDDIPALRGVIDARTHYRSAQKVDSLVVLAAITAGATPFIPAAGRT